MTEALKPGAVRYLRATLVLCGVEEARIQRIEAAVRDGHEWHPRNAGEMRAALDIMRDKLEGRPMAAVVLPFVGEVLREDCLP